MLPGGAVTPTYAAERKVRLAHQQCIATQDGRFVCDRPASSAALATGAFLCHRHNH